MTGAEPVAGAFEHQRARIVEQVFYDLDERRRKDAVDDVAICRLELLYPSPCERFEALARRYAGVRDFVWVQEEPTNMGSWSFVRPRIEALMTDRFRPLRYVGRNASASPATGSPESHKFEQDQILEQAFAGLE